MRSEHLHTIESAPANDEFALLNPEFSDIDLASVEQYESEYRKWLERDKTLSDIVSREIEEVKRFVEKYTGVDLAECTYDPEREVFVLHYSDEPFLPTLPPDYVFTGGCARAALERILGADLYGTPRDVDIAYAGSHEDKELSRAIAERYMPDDLRGGHGVKRCGAYYFTDRDFTINEVYFTGDTVYASKQCLLDTVRGIVRLTDYEKDDSYDGTTYNVKPKLLAKALRFITKERDGKRVYTFANEEVFDWQGIDVFHILLHLDRAMGDGPEAAQRYLDELHKRNLLPELLDNPESARLFLSERVYNFVFHHFDKEHKEREEIIDRWEEYDQALPVRESMHKPTMQL